MLMRNNRHSLDIYDEFHIIYYANEPVCKWMLVGWIKIEDDQIVQHYVVDSDNEEELLVWADMNNIKIEELTLR